MSKKRKIELLVLIILGGFILSTIYHYVIGNYFHKESPLNTFLFLSADQFMDFVNVYKIKSSVYFPFGNLIINFFCLFKPMKLSFLLFILSSIIPIFYYFWQNLKGDTTINSITNTLIFSLFTFPILFLIDRANFESFVFLFLILFVYLYQKEKIWFSLIPLSFAISMKLFPAVFIVLLLSDRKFKQVIVTGILVVILTLCSSFILSGSITDFLYQFSNSSTFYMDNYVIGDGGYDFGHSLFGFIKFIIYFFHLEIYIASILKPYSFLVLLLTVLVSLYTIFIETQLWKKIALLVFMMNLFPHVSANYKLIYIFIPLFIYINSEIENAPSGLASKWRYLDTNRLNTLYIILFGLLLIPKNYRLFSNIYDGVFLDPILMLAITCLIIFSGIYRFRFENLNFLKSGSITFHKNL